MTGPAGSGASADGVPDATGDQAAPGSGSSRTINDGGTEGVTFTVDSRPAHVTIRWPGEGHVVLTLVSPSGVEIVRDRLHDGVTHEVGATFESYHLSHPDPGIWTAQLTGDGVPDEGTPVRLTIHRDRPPEHATRLSIAQEVTGRDVTVTVHAGDTEVSSCLWEFGDGATSRRGPTVHHTYRSPGTYAVSVAVQDSAGRWHVATAEDRIVVR